MEFPSFIYFKRGLWYNFSMECYLDNSATTRVSDNVINIVTKVMTTDFGNPSSKHMKGIESENYLKDAKEVIAKILKVNAKEIVFTSGGTESNNMALIGYAMANLRRGRHIITTAFEHSSVKEALKYLDEMKLSEDIDPEKKGFEITYLSVDNEGHIDLEELKKAIRKDTILVSTMMVNNEIGAVQDIEKIGNSIKEINPSCAYHVDAIQGFGKFEIYPKKWKVDMLSVSAHKLHGPKGVGFLFIDEKIKVKPLILGGGQQKGMRSGTDNVPGVAGLAQCAKDAYDCLEENTQHLIDLKNQMIDGLEEIREDEVVKKSGCKIKINSFKDTKSAPHIVSATFFPVKSEVLLHALEEKGIYVSSGSACASNKPGLSGTLQSIGLSAKEADCTLRFSFCKDTKEEEIKYTLEQLKDLLPLLAKFVSK